MKEKEVLKILTQVNVTRRECEIVRTPFFILLLFEDPSVFKTVKSVALCHHGDKCQNLNLFVLFVEAGVDRLRRETGDQQEETDDLRGKGKLGSPKN